MSRASNALSLSGCGQGFWRHIGGTVYTAVVELFRFNSDGAFAGFERVTQSIDVQCDGKRFSATARSSIQTTRWFGLTAQPR